MKRSRTHLFALFTAACTVVLIAAGGLVTSTESGLSVPDWPLSYGTLNPPMVGGIRYEHTHRLIAAFVGLLTLALSAALWRTEKRAWLRRFGAAALGAVVLQAVLGGVTVLTYLPTWVSATHACIAQTFLCLIALIALFTSREWLSAPRVASDNARSLRRLVVVTSVFVYAQLVAGALLRHGVEAALPYHFFFAFLIVLHVLFVVVRSALDEASREALHPHAPALGALVIFQIFLGFGAFIFTRLPDRPAQPPAGEVLFATVHQTLGALILMTCVLLAARTFRLLRAPETERAAVPAAGLTEGA
jgi:heme a synthase